MSALNILVIDDDVEAFDDIEPRQTWFARRLSALGHNVTAAASSSEAYRLLHEHKFDLAFFDHDLGEAITGSTIAGQILYEPEEYQCPRAILVHSHNPIGAANIESKFRSAGVPTRVLDYSTLKAAPFPLLGDIINELLPQVGEAKSSEPVEGAKHKYELGAVVAVDVEISEPGFSTSTEVSLKGTCRLIVVGHLRDCDNTPLYILSDLAVRYPLEEETFSQPKLVYRYLATLVESGYGEESLRPTGERVSLTDTVAQWLKEGD